MESFIDIIMPVYNTPEKDIDVSIESVINQTFKDWRLCVIDDGSRSETAIYLDKWKKKDSRIEVYHFENGGPPVARNRGLSLIHAPFFMLIDSDDELTENFLSHSYNECVKNGLDMLVGSVDRVTENGDLIERHMPQLTRDLGAETMVYQDSCYLLDYALATVVNNQNSELNNILLGRLYPKLIRTESFRRYNILFEESMFNHDDNIFSFDLLEHFSRIGITEHIYYKYIEHSYSIVHRKTSVKILNEEIEYIRALHKRERSYKNAGCSEALAIRYIKLFAWSLSIAATCKGLCVSQVYHDISNIVNINMLAKSINLRKYVVSKREKTLSRLIRIPNEYIRKQVISFVFSLYGFLSGIIRR